MNVEQTKRDVEKLHDANMLAVIVGQEKSMRLLFQLDDGQACTLELLGVERFQADGFREGNIVLSVEVMSGSEIESTDVALLYGLRESEGAFDSLFSDAKEQKVVVRIDPSYGCQAIGLCQTINVLFG